MSMASAGEVESRALIAAKLGLLSPAQAASISRQVESIRKMLGARSRRVRTSPPLRDP